MGEVFTWTQAAFVLTLIGIGLTVWKIRAADKRVTDDKIDAMRRELSDFKLQVASTYATNAYLAGLESRLVTALERLGERIDRLLDRAK